MERLHISATELTSLTLSEDLPSLRRLYIEGNDSLTSLTLPEGLSSLKEIAISRTGLTSLTLPEGLSSLERLHISATELTSLTLPEGLSSLERLHIGATGLTSLILPEGLSSLHGLNLYNNFRLTSLTLSEDLPSLEEIHLTSSDRLTSLTLSEGLLSILQSRNLIPKSVRVINVYEYLPRITRRENGVEIRWEKGILQSATTVNGPWTDVPVLDDRRRLFLRSSMPAGFFRVKPQK